MTFRGVYSIKILKDYFGKKSLWDFKRLCKIVLILWDFKRLFTLKIYDTDFNGFIRKIQWISMDL